MQKYKLCSVLKLIQVWRPRVWYIWWNIASILYVLLCKHYWKHHCGLLMQTHHILFFKLRARFCNLCGIGNFSYILWSCLFNDRNNTRGLFLCKRLQRVRENLPDYGINMNRKPVWNVSQECQNQWLFLLHRGIENSRNGGRGCVFYH